MSRKDQIPRCCSMIVPLHIEGDHVVQDIQFRLVLYSMEGCGRVYIIIDTHE